MKKFVVLTLAIFLCANSCFAWNWPWKKDEKPTSAPSDEVQMPENGYVGTLPDLSKNEKTNQPSNSKPVFEKNKNFNSSNEIKPVPRDNPAFVNIMLKQDKTSPYINDLNQDILPQLENILSCIENSANVQMFNAKVYFFNKTVEYLQNKYTDKPEINYVSFKKLLELNTHTKSVANLRAEAEKYRPYMAYTGSGYLYQDNIIDQQLDYLKTEIEDTIVVLKEAK